MAMKDTPHSLKLSDTSLTIGWFYVISKTLVWVRGLFPLYSIVIAEWAHIVGRDKVVHAFSQSERKSVTGV